MYFDWFRGIPGWGVAAFPPVNDSKRQHAGQVMSG